MNEPQIPEGWVKLEHPFTRESGDKFWDALSGEWLETRLPGNETTPKEIEAIYIRKLPDTETPEQKDPSSVPHLVNFAGSIETPEPLSTQVGGTHYADMAIQPAEFIHANGIPYFEGNVLKYVCRHRAKNGAEDIKKAIQYLEMILRFDYGEEKP